VAQCCGIVDDLIEGEKAEVARHDLDDRQHPVQRRTDTGTDECELGERCVSNALFPELLKQALADGVRTALASDVFAYQEHALIPLQSFTVRLAKRVSVSGRCHSHAAFGV
jgi:hypothetical protein